MIRYIAGGLAVIFIILFVFSLLIEAL